MNNNYKKTIEPRPPIERNLDRSFYLSAKIFAIAIAGVLVWITILVTRDAIPALREFGITCY